MITTLFASVGGVTARDTGVNNTVEIAIARVDKLFLLISYHSLSSLNFNGEMFFIALFFFLKPCKAHTCKLLNKNICNIKCNKFIKVLVVHYIDWF